MTHILESTCITTDMMDLEHLQKVAKRVVPHVESALGVDEAKQFEADVADCANDNGDVASKIRRLREMCKTMIARMTAKTKEGRRYTVHLASQLEEIIGVTVYDMGSIYAEILSDRTKQKALTIALKLIAQFAGELSVANENIEGVELELDAANRESTLRLNAMQKLAALADSSKASLDAAIEPSVRSDIALRHANEKIAQLEKKAAEASDRIAQAVRDMQKLAYANEDPDRPTSSSIQQKPLVYLESTVQALKRANEGGWPDGDALNCTGCQDFKAKLDGLEKMLETMQKENQKLLEDKKDLLADRQRDKVEMEPH
ncbi:hypothetical protein AAVH_17252 [Aphelenchoides avenae]|nr:hypothetical protein AAVH_17252 [Aphelenchus avenae]